MNQKTKGVILGIIGYILSPLSWWNDLIVNIPLAYGFASAFGLISQKLFLPMMIIGYWTTNVLGLALMHYGISTATQKQGEINIKKQILISLGYTILIVVLIKLNILKFPTEYFR
ncbi:hypothetical protein KKD19_00035 [Patescibacteria group bacterium]|nr:hypothetical protein [Patescibacteria group bacterium]MBU4511628.1 hypothetical protein [Patescibacteria group bacterium]MCG2688470.1 hypothetical protein [Candidatus Parcubacteria bacterium]MCG2693612.1 hypothetical protein [Candidatus Parcubacteria bacterium]